MPIFFLILLVFLQACGVNTVDTDRVVDESPGGQNTTGASGGKQDQNPTTGDNTTATQTTNSSLKLPRSHYGLYNPLPGGRIGGYEADSGLDIFADHKPTYAVGAGTLVYSEHGHTTWTKGKDTPNSVLLKLNNPILLKNGRKVTHIYYTHLSKLAYNQAPGAKSPRKIAAGEFLGITGLGNNIPHLHIGFLLNNVTSQISESTYLSFSEIKLVLGSYNDKDILPSR